jgi:DNA-directed RNA polymerase specialized sigma24 family protein
LTAPTFERGCTRSASAWRSASCVADDSGIYGSAHSPESAWVTPERLDLWHGLAELRPQLRAALLLNVVDGYTQAEIARMLDAPEGTIASWIAAAKRRLRAALAEEPAP